MCASASGSSRYFGYGYNMMSSSEGCFGGGVGTRSSSFSDFWFNGGVGTRSFFFLDCWSGGGVGLRLTILSYCWSQFISWADSVGNVVFDSGVDACSEPSSSGSSGVS